MQYDFEDSTSLKIEITLYSLRAGTFLSPCSIIVNR